MHTPVCILTRITPTLSLQAQPNLLDQIVHLDQNAIFLHMPRLEAELFDAHFAAGLLVVAQDDSEGDGGGLGCFELRGEFGLEFIGEFGLLGNGGD